MRKIILMLVGLVSAVFGLFGVQLGLTAQVSAASTIGGLLIIAAYVFTEFKKDWADFVAGVKQETKWADPAFWTATIGAILIPLSQAFGFTLSESVISIISALLAIMIPILISFFRKTVPVPDVPAAVLAYLVRFRK